VSGWITHKNNTIGSSFGDFLAEEGICEEGGRDRRALVFKKHRFFAVPVPTVSAVVPDAGILFVPEVFRHLRRLQRTLEYPAGQLLD